MSRQVKTPQSQGVRAFFSFDLVGSAAFKSAATAELPNASGPAKSHLRPGWVGFFLDLFRKIPEAVQAQLESEFDRLGDQEDWLPEERIPVFRVEIWRITGDEVLFVSQRLSNAGQLALLARAVNTVLQDLDAHYLDRPKLHPSGEIGLKAVLWAAGFPIRNTEFLLTPQTSPFIRYQGDAWPSSRPEAGHAAGFEGAGFRMNEFLGPEIDLGFRLGTHSCPRRLLVSFDVAELIARHEGRLRPELMPHFHHVGWASLKGLYGEKPYPLIWFDYNSVLDRPRRSYETTQSPYLDRYFSGCKIDTRSLLSMAASYLRDTAETRIQMYIDPNPPYEHRIRYEASLAESEPNA